MKESPRRLGLEIRHGLVAAPAMVPGLAAGVVHSERRIRQIWLGCAVMLAGIVILILAKG